MSGVAGFLSGLTGGITARHAIDEKGTAPDWASKGIFGLFSKKPDPEAEPAAGAEPAVTEQFDPTPAPARRTARNGGGSDHATGNWVNEDSMEAYDWFQSRWGPHAAAGIVGNLIQESGPRLDANAVHDQGTGIGIAGWRDPEPGTGRKTALFNFARKNGLDPSSRETQYRFLDHELRTSEAGVGVRLRAAKDAREAATIFVGYERPQGWSADNPMGANGIDNRINAALAFGGRRPSQTAVVDDEGGVRGALKAVGG